MKSIWWGSRSKCDVNVRKTRIDVNFTLGKMVLRTLPHAPVENPVLPNELWHSFFFYNHFQLQFSHKWPSGCQIITSLRPRNNISCKTFLQISKFVCYLRFTKEHNGATSSLFVGKSFVLCYQRTRLRLNWELIFVILGGSTLEILSSQFQFFCLCVLQIHMGKYRLFRDYSCVYILPPSASHVSIYDLKFSLF